MVDTEVLIVGAGPTGLALALWLTRLGVKVRIIDRAAGPGGASRAFLVQARTLEFYDQLGLAHEPIIRGRKIETLNVHTRSAALRLPFGDFGEDLSRFPFLLVLLQDRHEKMLIDHLAELGVEVDWRRQLIDLVDEGPAVSARIGWSDGLSETCRAAYVCGCDGAFSAVRDLLGVAFVGVSGEEYFYVADVEAQGAMADGELHYSTIGDGLCSVFPLDRQGRVRLVGLVPDAVAKRAVQIGFAEVADQVNRDTGLKVFWVDWFAAYRARERRAAKLKQGRVFLLGDAGHVHSPAGGQGLNAGIGDAVNLAWKLAAVLQGRAGAGLLDTYAVERAQAARQIGRTTDRGLVLQAGQGPISRLARLELPALAPGLMRFKLFRRWLFRTMSQLNVSYRAAGVLTGRAVTGDRLPWVRSAQNLAPLRAMDWQVHVYGAISEPLRDGCRRMGMALFAFPWTPDMAAAGLARNAAYLVRPDGYIAEASPGQDPQALTRALARFDVRAVPAASETAPSGDS